MLCVSKPGGGAILSPKPGGGETLSPKPGGGVRGPLASRRFNPLGIKESSLRIQLMQSKVKLVD